MEDVELLTGCHLLAHLLLHGGHVRDEAVAEVLRDSENLAVVLVLDRFTLWMWAWCTEISLEDYWGRRGPRSSH